MFRSFSCIGSEFRFAWLWGLPFQLAFDRKSATLEFRKLLPNVAAGSDLEVRLKAFVRGFHAPDRPAHRRLDPARLAVHYFNRRGTATLAFAVRDQDPGYAVQKALQVVNEIFLGFLNLHYPEYMAANFRLPQE